MASTTYPSIKPIDWCLIQYLIGYDINSNYVNLEDTFKVLLKQYILHFNATNISSRDKKRLLEEFLNDYKNFNHKQSSIKEALNKNSENQPNDDLVLKTLEVATFRMLENPTSDLEGFNQFIKDNNQQFSNLFKKITQKININQ